VVSKDGQVHLAGRYVIAAEILGGRRVGVRIEENTLRFGVSRGAHLPRRLQAESDATFHPVDIPRQPGSSSLLSSVRVRCSVAAAPLQYAAMRGSDQAVKAMRVRLAATAVPSAQVRVGASRSTAATAVVSRASRIGLAAAVSLVRW
jgi:hypothetical protein